MSAGYSGTPLARKLGIREGHRVATLAAPEGFPGTLDLPPSVRLEADPERPEAPARTHDVVLVFATDPDTLEARFESGRRLLTWDGGLWVAWPKASSSLTSTIGKWDVRDHGLARGLVDNKVCAVDGDWSALRFVHRLEDRPGR